MEPIMQQGFLVALCLVLMCCGMTFAKDGRTWYTPAKMAIARRNIAQYAWAQQQRDQIITRADRLLKYDTAELLFRFVPPPHVWRAYTVHASGCPVHGEAAHAHGAYAWGVDPDKPYQITCPAGGETYPSNDFAAYLRSGMTDESLLTGDYADVGRGWTKQGVDKKFWFVGFYAHWVARNHLLPALDDLGRAYLFTDDARYAHACAALLWRLAEYYPDYNYETQSRYATEFLPGYNGRLMYHTWETLTVQTTAPAYDAIWPAIESDAALQRMTGQTAAGIRNHIETRLLRTMATDITDGSSRIGGNFGMHQVGLLRIAAALDDHTSDFNSDDMIDWVMNNTNATIYTQFGLNFALNNLIHRDGFPFESPSYSLYWIYDIVDMGEALRDAGVNIFDQPRMASLMRWPEAMTVAGAFAPAYGDSNNMFHQTHADHERLPTLGLRHTGDPMFARTMVQSGIQPVNDLFSEPLGDIAEIAERHPEPIGMQSRLLPAVGFASLQTGPLDNRTAVTLFYGLFWGHGDYDRLQLDFYGEGDTLIPDFGYPDTCDEFDPRRHGFFVNTVSHNTVMVDATRQAGQAWGRLHVYDPGSFAQLVESSCENAYPDKTSLYRRTVMLIDASPQRAYMVDIFRVRGGTQHDWIVHGTQADFTSSLPLSEPGEGTVAGANVPYGQFYDDLTMRDAPTGTVSYAPYAGSGLQWLYNPQRAPLQSGATATWTLTRPADVYPNRHTAGAKLRAHLIGEEEVIHVADAKPQFLATWPESVKFVLRRRTSSGELESTYVTVFEAYRGEPTIQSVRALPVEGGEMPVALLVDLGDVKHLVVNRLEADARAMSIDTPLGAVEQVGRAAVLVDDDGAWRPRYVLNPNGTPTARVTAVDYRSGSIAVSAPLFNRGTLPAGSIAIVENADHAGAIPIAAIANPTRFSVGDHPLYAARVIATDTDGRTLRYAPPGVSYARVGMAVVNEAGRPIGRVARLGIDTIELDIKAPALRALPDSDRDGHRTVSLMCVGVGDTITVHHSSRD
jgi:hypothetical protein